MERKNEPDAVEEQMIRTARGKNDVQYCYFFFNENLKLYQV